MQTKSDTGAEKTIVVWAVSPDAASWSLLEPLQDLGKDIHLIILPEEQALQGLQASQPEAVLLPIDEGHPLRFILLRRIVQEHHIPALCLALSHNSILSVLARSYGAYDVVPAPQDGSTEELRALSRLLRDKIHEMVASPHREGSGQRHPAEDQRPRVAKIGTGPLAHPQDPILVVIAASTGGPQCLDNIFANVPASAPAAFIIVQHMPAGFTASFAQRLDRSSPLKVKEAEEGDPLTIGGVVVARGGYHLTLRRPHPSAAPCTHLDDGPPFKGLRPAADVLLNSIAGLGMERVIAAIMTGMGSDGTEGARKIKELGGWVIAQDEDSSVIFGMPHSAITAGVVDITLPLDEIPTEIMRAVTLMRVRERYHDRHE